MERMVDLDYIPDQNQNRGYGVICGTNDTKADSGVFVGSSQRYYNDKAKIIKPFTNSFNLLINLKLNGLNCTHGPAHPRNSPRLG